MRLLRPRTAFTRNVLALAGGTALAQAIAVLTGPILTRLFAPEAFGVLALYLAVVTLASVAASGRYELAILTPKADEEARDLLVVALLLSVIVGIFGELLILLARLPVANDFGVPHIPRWAYLVPAGALLTAVVQSLGYWVNRRARYRPLIQSRVLQSASMFSAQFIGGLGAARSISLLTGHLIGQGVAVCTLAINIRRDDWPFLRAAKWASVKRAALVHRRFPAYIMPGHVANATSSQLPTILLIAFFGPAIAGLYSLAERVLVLPSSLIGNSVGDVYRQEAAETYNRLGNCRDLYLRTLRKLALVGFVPCAAVILAGPWLFAFVFGPAWRESGVLASILAAMVFFQIISSPLSQTVLLADMHRIELVWQLARVVVSAGAFLSGALIFHDHRTGVALYAAGFAVLHLLHSIMQYRAACGFSPLARAAD